MKQYRTISTLTQQQKDQIIDLWNVSYPSTINLTGPGDFELFLSKLKDQHHLLLVDENEKIKGWFFDFFRDGERWFAMIVAPELKGHGIGSQMIRLGKAFNDELNGWVVQAEDYKTKDGNPYHSPVSFYRKQDFMIRPEVKQETPAIKAMKITWRKQSLMDENMERKGIQIKETKASDLEVILSINREAFGSDDVGDLVAGLLRDPSAGPVLSLLAYVGDEPAGYILFTKATIEDTPEQPLIHILAPLAIRPDFQKQGIGGLLIEEGIARLKESGTQMVFVLGHETYYPKFGFIPDARSLGFPATYPIPEAVAGAWMIYPLTRDVLNVAPGRIICADAMNSPEHWRE